MAAFLDTTATQKIFSLKKRIRAVSGGTSASKTISILVWLIDRGQSVENDTPSFNFEYVIELSNNEGNYESYNGFKIVVSNNDVQFNSAQALEQARLLSGVIPKIFPVTFPDKFREFMSPANNAIVRSFESTRGKGLAGVITSLDFQWNIWSHI